MVEAATLEIVAHVLTYFTHCPHCETALEAVGVGSAAHTQEINEYPEEFKAEYVRLCDWIRAASARYPGRLRIRLVDAQSPAGLWKTLRHRARTYPLFVLDGRPVAVGWPPTQVEAILMEKLGPLMPLTGQSAAPGSLGPRPATGGV